VAAGQAASAVRAAVRLLPDGQRRVVELAYFEGLTCREVALAAGIPEGTAKSRLRLALASWRPCWTGSCWSRHDGEA
jgi:RNA polymerase sigma-70 factor (ECF subfamily)